MYFCSSLNKKLWFLPGFKAGRDKVACRKGELGFQELWSILVLALPLAAAASQRVAIVPINDPDPLTTAI